MIVLLTGANDFGVRSALDAIVVSTLSKHGAHAIERIDGESLDPSRLPDLLQGGSLFATDRLVVVRDAAKNKIVWDALGDYAQKVPDEITLVLVESAADKRTRTYKQIQAHGRVQEYAELTEPELVRWAIGVAKQGNQKLDPRTASYLIRQVGPDQWRLHSELQKLMASGQPLTTTHIDALVEPNPQASAFELLDAALQGNSARTAELLTKLKANEDPYKLFGLLVSQIHTLAVVATAGGKSPDSIAKAAGIHPYVAKKMQPLARGFTHPQIQGIIAAVALADTQMKSTGADPWVLLAQCLGKIAARVV